MDNQCLMDSQPNNADVASVILKMLLRLQFMDQEVLMVLF
jgi:hypothetical protein